MLSPMQNQYSSIIQFLWQKYKVDRVSVFIKLFRELALCRGPILCSSNAF